LNCAAINLKFEPWQKRQVKTGRRIGGKEKMFSNWEDSLMGLSFAGAVAFGMTLNHVRTPELAVTAMAADKPAQEAFEPMVLKPQVSFTVTGKRTPKECKGEPKSVEIAVRCEALRDQTTVDVKLNK
jgi:hypothetical protein